MIKSIKIDCLYNLYTYNIEFNNDPNVLILTGPNGFGKTTILQIIRRCCSCNLWYFYFITFKTIVIEFTEDFIFELSQEDTDGKKSERNVLFQMYTKDDLLDRKDLIEEFSISSEYINQLVRHTDRVDYYIEDDSIENRLAKYYNPLKDDYINDKLPLYIEYLKSQNCLLIEEQRLNIAPTYRYQSSKKTVEQIQERLAQYYSSAQKTYNQESLRIDGSFIKRLSDLQEHNDEQLKHIKKEKIYQEVKSLIKDYQKYGLVKELNVVSDLGVHYNGVLKLYLHDLKTKLYSIKSYYKKLATFDRLVSGKRLSNKHIVFEDDRFSIKDSLNKDIPIGKLSSGEQNLIILCYKLVFEIDEHSILLVDEPENSLHMAWLDNLLSDYLSIAETTGCQIIMATHSPALIHGKWDLTYDLCENEQISNT